MTYKTGSIGDFMRWTKQVVTDPVAAKDTPKRWFDSDETAAKHLGTLASCVARAIYGMQFNPQSTLKALCYFDEGNLRRLAQPVKDRLVKAACEVDLARLPIITVSGRSTDHDPGFSR